MPTSNKHNYYCLESKYFLRGGVDQLIFTRMIKNGGKNQNDLPRLIKQGKPHRPTGSGPGSQPPPPRRGPAANLRKARWRGGRTFFVSQTF